MAVETGKPTEIFMENLHLKEDNQKLHLEKQRVLRHPSLKRRPDGPKTDNEISASDEQSENEITPEEEEKMDLLSALMTDKDTRILIERSHNRGICSKAGQVKSSLKYFALVLLIVLGVVAAFVVVEIRHDRALQSLLNASSAARGNVIQVPGILPVASQIKDINGEQEFLQKYHLSIGMRQDQKLQECQFSQLKHSFPDVDYALLGYNILKGFPMAVGHDPGFTYPIFEADYSKGGQTADCRYSVPSGLVIIPDVSCVTSFSSTTVRNKYEFSKSLGVSASVSGGGWGVQFSASAGYKEASSEMSTGESVFILSTANCNYYFSKLIIDHTPPFDDVFLQWIYRLNSTDWDSDLYFNFFETYGTHFPTEVTFGARFTYEHKMNSQQYETEQSKGVNVGVQASYSGLFSAGGGFNMDASQREAASNFASSVTTKTITVGAAPPANGDAMTWASEVKESPVPTAYKLSSIDELFTKRQMGHLNIDYERIRKLIKEKKLLYCQDLQENGKVETCVDLVAGIEMKNTRLFKHYKELPVESMTDCIETCLQELLCEATTFCQSCNSTDTGYKTCYLYKQNGYTSSASKDEKWQSNIYSEKIKSQIEFNNTRAVGVTRGFENPGDKLANVTTCYELCMKDAYCVAYSHCRCPDKGIRCQMYSKLQGLEKESGTNTYFISSRSSVPTTVKPLVTTTPESNSSNTTSAANATGF